MMKMEEDKDMTDRISLPYVENEIELSWPIRLSVKHDENQIEQWRHWSRRCCLHWKQEWVALID